MAPAAVPRVAIEPVGPFAVAPAAPGVKVAVGPVAVAFDPAGRRAVEESRAGTTVSGPGATGSKGLVPGSCPDRSRWASTGRAVRTGGAGATGGAVATGAVVADAGGTGAETGPRPWSGSACVGWTGAVADAGPSSGSDTCPAAVRSGASSAPWYGESGVLATTTSRWDVSAVRSVAFPIAVSDALSVVRAVALPSSVESAGALPAVVFRGLPVPPTGPLTTPAPVAVVGVPAWVEVLGAAPVGAAASGIVWTASGSPGVVGAGASTGCPAVSEGLAVSDGSTVSEGPAPRMGEVCSALSEAGRGARSSRGGSAGEALASVLSIVT
ncbi:hypothetical protein GCM10023317_70740 [Actinopolymorpha pittospori]